MVRSIPKSFVEKWDKHKMDALMNAATSVGLRYPARIADKYRNLQ